MPESHPLNLRLCDDCGHAEHDGGFTAGDCYCSAQFLADGRLQVCGCGYQTYASRGRCSLRTKTSIHNWGCHKPAGHDGYCSTHWDCGHMTAEHAVCGRKPQAHGGPCEAHI